VCNDAETLAAAWYDRIARQMRQDRINMPPMPKTEQKEHEAAGRQFSTAREYADTLTSHQDRLPVQGIAGETRH